MLESSSTTDSQGADKRVTPADDVRHVGLLRRWLRRAVFVCGVAFVGVVLFILSPLPNVIFNAMDCQDPLTRADYIICLGGDPSRVVEAAKLLQEGYAPTLVVSNRGESAARMRAQAVEWGAPADRIVTDTHSSQTSDHPAAVAKAAGIDIKHDTCIIVTSYAHMARARAVFAKAGYRHIIMREPRFERQARSPEGKSWRGRFLNFPTLVYEGAGWVQYWLAGRV